MVPLNTQPIEPVVDSKVLEVNSIWSTNQGEGPMAGWSAIFVRMAGCVLQCSNCDTLYTEREQMTGEGIHKRVLLENMARFNPDFKPLVVITGGEPLRQRIDYAIEPLLRDGYGVQIETNGVCALRNAMAFTGQNSPGNANRFSIVCSPKTRVVHKELLPWITAYKYVINGIGGATDSVDGLPTTVLGDKCRVFRPDNLKEYVKKGMLFIQPEDTQNEALNKINMDKCVQLSARHGYRLGGQLHKAWGVP